MTVIDYLEKSRLLYISSFSYIVIVLQDYDTGKRTIIPIHYIGNYYKICKAKYIRDDYVKDMTDGIGTNILRIIYKEIN